MRLRPISVAAVAFTVVLLFPLLMFSPASAVTVNCTSPHCYSTVEWDNTSSGITGGYDTVYVVAGSAADYSSGHFIDEELWVGTNNSNPSTYWVEVGYTYGPVAGYSGPGPNWYWADYRPNGIYTEHIPSFANPSNYMNQNIAIAAAYSGSSTWTVYIGGTSQGLSTSNPAGSGGLATGLEVYSGNNSSYLNGSVDGSMEWQNAGWHSYWGSSTYKNITGPTTGGWYTTDYIWTNSLP